MRYEGTVWRHIPEGGYALDLQYVIKASGRWNRKGSSSCLYTATTKAGALAEFRKLLGRNVEPGLSLTSRKLVSIDVQVEPVLNLTDPAVRKELELKATDITANTAQSREQCRRTADWAIQQNLPAIMAPSAALIGEVNLMLYTENASGNLSISPGGTEIPINDQLLEEELYDRYEWIEGG